MGFVERTRHPISIDILEEMGHPGSKLGSWDQSGFLCLPQPSSGPCSLRLTPLCLSSFSSQVFSWGDSLFSFPHGFGLPQLCTCCRTTFLFKHHHLSPLCLTVSITSSWERESNWSMSISGPVGSVGSSLGRWCGSRGAALKGHCRKAMARGQLQKGAVRVARANEEGNANRCVFWCKDQGLSESENRYCYF